jgi:hypothetical protein
VILLDSAEPHAAERTFDGANVKVAARSVVLALSGTSSA